MIAPLALLAMNAAAADMSSDADPSPSPAPVAIAAQPPADEDLAAMVERLAVEEGLDPALLDALVWAESAYRVDAVSPKGARGLAQLMPATAEELGVPMDEIHDPETNVRAGARYLRQQINAIGTVAGGLAAYNAGPACGARSFGQWPRETQAYVLKILRRTGALPPQPALTARTAWKGGMASMTPQGGG